MSDKFDTRTFLRVSREHIEAQHKKFLDVIDRTFTGDRHTNLKRLYSDFESRLIASPASGKVFHHCAYEGGYLDHVLNVIDAAPKVTKLYAHLGGTVDFSQEELIFAAMHHDLGKLGDDEGPYYEKEYDDFWLKKGYTFKRGAGTQTSTVYDKTVYLLGKYGIPCTKKELIGIRMADGVFEPANKAYFEAFGVFPHKTAIGYIVHWADWMSTNTEKDRQRKEMGMD